jgi:hypothetical protein
VRRITQPSRSRSDYFGSGFDKLPVEAAAPEKPADLTAATDNLANLLGKKKRSFNKPWYDGLES